MCKKRLSQLRDSQAKLEKNVNMKVLSMFDKAEKEYTELLKKKTIVEQDKTKVSPRFFCIRLTSVAKQDACCDACRLCFHGVRPCYCLFIYC